MKIIHFEPKSPRGMYITRFRAGSKSYSRKILLKKKKVEKKSEIFYSGFVFSVFIVYLPRLTAIVSP